MVLGLLVFLVDVWFVRPPEGERDIVLDGQRLQELQRTFTAAQGREPSVAETDQLALTWAEQEILYREAKQLQLERGDDVVRNRLINKMQEILLHRTVAGEPSRAQLETFFKTHQDAYGKPAHYDFEQFFVGDSEIDAKQLAAELQSAQMPEQYAPGYTDYRYRPASNIAVIFGDDSLAMLQSVDRRWYVVESQRGYHLARVTKVYAGQPADFAHVQARVKRDWLLRDRERRLAEQILAVAGNYQVRWQVDREPTLNQAGAAHFNDAVLAALQARTESNGASR